jgi:F-type H+-transporting ATPase subunit b
MPYAAREGGRLVKGGLGWIVVLVVLVGFAWLVDQGNEHLHIPDFVWLPLNLTAFLYVLYRFVGKPLGRFLDSRREGIANDLKQAEDKLAEAKQLRAQVVERLAAVEKELEELRGRAEREAEAEAAEIRERTRVDAERFLKRIDEEIGRRQVETRQALARETAELTALLTRELLSREMTEDDRRRVLDRSLGALTVLKGGE